MASNAATHFQSAEAANAKRSRIRKVSQAILLPAIASMALFATIELVARTEIFASRQFLPPPSAMIAALFRMASNGILWSAIWNTLLSVGIGLMIATAGAIPLGLFIGTSRVLDHATRVVIEFLRPVPSVALIPLAILIYGNGLESKIFLISFASFWPILIQAIYGMRDIDPVAMDTARCFGFSRAQRLLLVGLPSTVPYISTGMRVSFSVALILAVTAELIIGNPGLGKEISLARQVGNIENMYALIGVTGLVGWGLNSVISMIDRRVLFWHHSYRKRELI